MVDIISYSMIVITALCFGLIVSFQIAHINYCRKLTQLLRRSIYSKSLGPVLAELEMSRPKM